MFIIYKGNDYDGKILYNINCVIGVYEDIAKARYDLLGKLDKLKYTYELEIDTNEYLFVKCLTRNGIELCNNPIPSFEIMERKLCLNEIKFRS